MTQSSLARRRASIWPRSRVRARRWGRLAQPQVAPPDDVPVLLAREGPYGAVIQGRVAARDVRVGEASARRCPTQPRHRFCILHPALVMGRWWARLAQAHTTPRDDPLILLVWKAPYGPPPHGGICAGAEWAAQAGGSSMTLHIPCKTRRRACIWRPTGAMARWWEGLAQTHNAPPDDLLIFRAPEGVPMTHRHPPAVTAQPVGKGDLL